MFIASELTYFGRGTIESHNDDGTLIVLMADGRRGRVLPEQTFETETEAREFARPPRQLGGWGDAAQIAKVVASR